MDILEVIKLGSTPTLAVALAVLVSEGLKRFDAQIAYLQEQIDELRKDLEDCYKSNSDK